MLERWRSLDYELARAVSARRSTGRCRGSSHSSRLTASAVPPAPRLASVEMVPILKNVTGNAVSLKRTGFVFSQKVLSRTTGRQ